MRGFCGPHVVAVAEGAIAEAAERWTCQHGRIGKVDLATTVILSETCLGNAVIDKDIECLCIHAVNSIFIDNLLDSRMEKCTLCWRKSFAEQAK